VDWTQVGTNISLGFTNDQFGDSVALSSDGTNAVIGEPNTQTAAVTAYELISGQMYAKGFTLLGASNGGRFGSSVAISGDGNGIVVGSFR